MAGSTSKGYLTTNHELVGLPSVQNGAIKLANGGIRFGIGVPMMILLAHLDFDLNKLRREEHTIFCKTPVTLKSL